MDLRLNICSSENTWQTSSAGFQVRPPPPVRLFNYILPRRRDQTSNPPRRLPKSSNSFQDRLFSFCYPCVKKLPSHQLSHQRPDKSATLNSTGNQLRVSTSLEGLMSEFIPDALIVLWEDQCYLWCTVSQRRKKWVLINIKVTLRVLIRNSSIQLIKKNVVSSWTSFIKFGSF